MIYVIFSRNWKNTCFCDTWMAKVLENNKKKQIFPQISAWGVLNSVLNFLANFSLACLYTACLEKKYVLVMMVR